jgi:hypothetical protein
VHRAPGIPHALCFSGAEHFGQTSGASRRETAKLYLTIIASAKQSMQQHKKGGLLRGACHRARIRATRRLAMTAGERK